MKACYKKLFLISALFLSTSYIQNEMNISTSSKSQHYREIAGEQVNPHTQEISISMHQEHQKGIVDLWFDSAKLFGKVSNITTVEIKSSNPKLVKDFKELNKRFIKLQEESSSMTQELAKSSEEISSLKEQLEKVQNTDSDQVDEQIRQEKIVALEELIEQRTKELDAAKDAISKFEETRDNLKEISEKLTGLEEENKSLKIENAKLACEIKNEQSKVESQEISRLEAELAQITSELEEYKSGSNDQDDDVQLDDQGREVITSADIKDESDEDEKSDAKATEAELALVEYLETMKEQIVLQREQQQIQMMQQLIAPMTSSFTRPQINSHFGTFDAYNQKNQDYLGMLMDFRQQSMMIQNLNSANDWKYGYSDYYGANAPMMRISQSMPWGNYMTPEQSITTQDYDHGRFGYSWGTQIPQQNFNIGLNSTSSSPILQNHTSALNANNNGDFRLF